MNFRCGACGLRRLGVLSLAPSIWLLALAGCTGKSQEPEILVPTPEVETLNAEIEVLTKKVDELDEALRGERQARAESTRENQELRQRLAEGDAALASLEERYAALEFELESAIEEVIRTGASVRGVGSRALAISRISEVRVQLEAVPDATDMEVAARLGRARDFLNRADEALENGNYGGASYLAAKAGELVRQARIVAELRASSSSETHEIIPIVPPRDLIADTNANLRAGPGTDHEKVGALRQGELVTAVARSGEWYQVRTETGLVAWVHGRLVH